ncbi:putative DNA binding domain-containing protein [Pseudomonas sp. KSR10]|uniref:RNA-binding domain-containing protein n=1 Tax=Pseudomonas sp. KSR10 TaxID=2916654 RepID=UPI001EF7C842|nr:RNA-binding domain-containing protein [Pseudomonas sp. KSR10]MCG6540668.1 putative DNA binding domain-containing protein [Pseudomonas sp. KSR10]
MTQDELLARLNGIEWNDFECKRAQRGVPEDAYKTVSAFANTAGGWLVFGVSEVNGQLEVTGVEEPDKVQNDFLAVLRGGQKLNRVIAVEAHRFEIDGRHVFAFHVPESSRSEKPAYLKGDPRQSYLRRGAGDEQFTQSELERFLRDAAQDRYDGIALSDIPVDQCFDETTVKWYQAQFARRNPEHVEITDPIEFLLNWNFLIERDGQVLPTRAGILLFGIGRYVRQILPRPVLDYQRIDRPSDQWSTDERWHDRYVFEENIFQTWQGLVARYMRIAEHPFSLDPATLRRNDDPPDYVAFREAAINLLVHQDYGDHGRKASIKLFTDRTVFWNPGDAFATEAELLDPTEKEVRNPAIVKAFRRIGLSDQAGTGIRAIFRNWHELGRTPPQLKNDKARKEFELVLINKPLVTDGMLRFRQTLGTNLTPEQADALALALSLPEGEPLTLTAIRSLGIRTTQQARLVADHLVRQQLFDQLSDTQFQVRETIRQRFAREVEAQPIDQAGTKSGPGRDQVGTKCELSAEQRIVLAQMAEEHDIATLMQWVGRSNRSKFREVVLLPLLALELVAMTIPDKPSSSKQRYRLTDQGRAMREEIGE